MRLRRCPRCGKIKKLTRHSKIGGHLPPFEMICRGCHDKEHGIKQNKTRQQMRKCQKYQPGTKRMHKSKRRKQ